jgi:hypothetical protein
MDNHVRVEVLSYNWLRAFKREGDELYTRVKKHVAPDESQGWTVVLMDRATRFLWDMHCGRKDRKMFKTHLPPSTFPIMLYISIC